jgi:ribosomal protein L19
MSPPPHAAAACRYSPHITEIKVLDSRKVRRAKLFYLRDRTAKEYRT